MSHVNTPYFSEFSHLITHEHFSFTRNIEKTYNIFILSSEITRKTLQKTRNLGKNIPSWCSIASTLHATHRKGSRAGRESTRLTQTVHLFKSRIGKWYISSIRLRRWDCLLMCDIFVMYVFFFDFSSVGILQFERDFINVLPNEAGTSPWKLFFTRNGIQL